MNRYFIPASGPIKDSEGPWVKWENVKDLITSLREEITSLEEENEMLAKD